MAAMFRSEEPAFRVEIRGPLGNAPPLSAAGAGVADVLQELIAQGADVRAENSAAKARCSELQAVLA